MQTHRRVGKYLYQRLEEKEQEKLDYYTFIWANVKPDLLSEYKKISHYYPANKEYVFRLLEKACDLRLSKRDFSETSGVLIHFLCDYACTYHANMKVNEAHSMSRHMGYEFLLHGYTLRKLKKTEAKQMSLKTIEEVKIFILEIIQRVDLAEMVIDMKADFYAMLAISSSVLQFLLDQRT